MERWTELALVAHEIGGALTPTRNAVQLLQDGRPGGLTEQQQHLLRLAQRGLERVDRVLTNLAGIAAPEAYASEAQEWEPAAWLATWLGEHSLESESREITLELDVDPRVRSVPVDLFALEHVLVNLLSNAFKFTPPGGRVRLEVRAARGAVLPGRMVMLAGGFGFMPRFIQLTLSDTGCGLTDETLRRLFQPFFRGPEAAHVPGMGLGLTVAKRMIRLLHGDLRAERADAGARFVVTLPADAATLQLASRVDDLQDDIREDLAGSRQNVVVLRRQADAGPTFAVFASALQESLARVRLHELSATTWVIWSAQPMRAVWRETATALCVNDGFPALRAFAAQSRQASSGIGVDEFLLQLLVRCREPLPEQVLSREVLHAEDPDRGR